MNNHCWSWFGLGILLICAINHNNGQISQQNVIPLSQRSTNNPNLIPGWSSTSGQIENNINLNFNQPQTRYRNVNPIISQIISDSVMNISLNFVSLFGKYSLTGSQIFSPVSIATSLSLLHLGSKGQTFNDLNNFLGYNKYSYPTGEIHRQFGLIIKDLLESTPNPERPDEYWKNTAERLGLTNDITQSTEDQSQKLNITNGVFIQYGFSLHPDYEDVVKNIYKSELTNLDFEKDRTGSKNYINQWVNYYTNGKIPTIIEDEFDLDTNMLLANALYFKGYWEKKFSEAPLNTFYPDGVQGTSINIKMIADFGVYPHYEDVVDGVQIIGIPYKGGLTTMYLIHPLDSSRQKLYQFQTRKLSASKLDYWISKMTKKSAIIVMPKMHITNSFHMQPILTELGLGRLFSKAQSDFSLMYGEQPKLYSNAPTTTPPQRFTNPIKPIFNRINEQQPIQITFPERFGTDDDNNNKNKTSNLDNDEFIKENNTLNISSNKNSENSLNNTNRSKRSVTYKVESSIRKNEEPLRFKDFVLNKRITKSNPGKKLIRSRRQVPSRSSLENLDTLRNIQENKPKPPLWVNDVVHKVDLVINEYGTEGGAATVTTFRKTGPQIILRLDTPYLILIRHDTTKMPLFFGPIYEPARN